MDVLSLPGEEEDVASDATSTLGVEELPTVSRQEMELAQEDGHGDTSKVLPIQSGPILRCLKRLYQNEKRGERRNRRIVTRVPDIPTMQTLWEVDESGREDHAVEGTILLLESWTNTINYYNHYKTDSTMQNTFFRLFSILSETIDWPNMPNCFLQAFASDTAGVIVEMIKEEPRESLSVTIVFQAMATVTNMSKRHLTKAMGSHERMVLMRTFLKFTFSLPTRNTLQAQETRSTDSDDDEKDVFVETMRIFLEMLKSLIVENPVPAELERILQLMDPWMQCRKVSLRLRALWISTTLLKFVDTKVKLDEASPFTSFGHMAAVLALCCEDPIGEVSSKAEEGICHLTSIVWRQKSYTNVDNTEQRNENCPLAWSPTVVLNSPSRIVEIVGVNFSPEEWTDFILTLINSLTDHSNKNLRSSAEGLLSAVMNSGGMRMLKVNDMVAHVCSRLHLVQHPSSRTMIMNLVGSLASHPEHLDAVISCLLEHSSSTHRTSSNSAELWRFLAADPAFPEVLMKKLVGTLERHHTSKHSASHISAAATCTLHEIISARKSNDVIRCLFPQLLMALLVEVHFSLGKSLPHHEISGRESTQDSIHTSSAVEAMKMLLHSVGCDFELCLMEEEQGWGLLQSPQDHLRAVSILARAMLKHACPDIPRLLEHVIPLLDTGDKKRRLTMMAFFVELLHSKEAKLLPHSDTLHHLKEWTKASCPAFRSLGLKGLSILATQPGKVEQVKSLLPIILWGSEETEDGSILEAIPVVSNLLHSLEGKELSSVARKLIPLFSAVRPQVRSAAITLFIELLSAVKRREQHLLEEQVTRSLVPLLLHLQDEDPDLRKRCQEALARCFRLLGWALPKQIKSKKAWHDHPQVVEKICQHSVLKLQNIPDILLQSLHHFQSPQVSIRRAAAIFIGCTVERSHPTMVGQEEKELILQALDGLRRDPDYSVCVSALQAYQQVQEGSRNQSSRSIRSRLRNIICCFTGQE